MVLHVVDLSNNSNSRRLSDYPADAYMFKATEGTGFVDGTCDQYVQQAIAMGKPWGVYHFMNGENWQAQADAFLNATKGYAGKGIFCLDYEAYGRQGPAVAKAWLDYVQSKTGVKPIIYMSASVTTEENWSSVVAADYGLWVAAYGANPPNVGYWKNYLMWQYTESPYDQSNLYGDVGTWNAYAGNKGVVSGHLDAGNFNTDSFYVNGWMKQSGKDLSKTTPWLFFLDSDNNSRELARVKGKWVNRPDVGNAGLEFGGLTPQTLIGKNYKVMFRASDDKGDNEIAELDFTNLFTLPKINVGHLDGAGSGGSGVANNQVVLTEINRTVLVNRLDKTVDTLPWGMKGFINLAHTTAYTGKVVKLTQDSGSYVYSPDLKGWVDKKGVEDVQVVNQEMTIYNAGFSIDPYLWYPGIVHNGVTGDHIGQKVLVTAKTGGYNYVATLGWIDEKAFINKSQVAIKVGDQVLLKTSALRLQTGEVINADVKGKNYTVMQIKDVNQSVSKKAYLLKEILSWVLEQDVELV